MKIHLIWAQDNNGGIGKDNKLPWHISEDLINFKKLTLNKPIIMGRKTWDSLPKKPLPRRRNIVLSSKKVAGVESYNSIESCLKSLKNDNLTDVFVIGGEMIYKSFFNYSHTLHITFINKKVSGIDVFFPIKIDEIEKKYIKIEKNNLTNECIYTKWEKQSN